MSLFPPRDLEGLLSSLELSMEVICAWLCNKTDTEVSVGVGGRSEEVRSPYLFCKEMYFGGGSGSLCPVMVDTFFYF